MRAQEITETTDYFRRREQERKKEQGVAEGIMKSLATRLVKGAANRQTPQEIANTHVRALNQRAPGTRMQGHPNFADFKREIHSYISAAQNGEQAFARTTDDHVKSLFKKYFSEGVAEGSGNWYVRVKGKVLKDKKFDAIPFPSQESARLKAMEIHDKKRIPLDMIKLTQSWMDGPETQGVAEGFMKSLAIKLLDKKTPQEVANSAVSAINKKASGTKMHGHPNFVDFKREVHRYVSAADSGSEAVRRSSDDHVKSLFKKYFSEGVAEGSGKNVVKSVKVGNFRHDLVDTGMGWQVRIYNGDELYDTGMSKNSEQKGLAALEDAVAYTEKQTRTKRQGVAEGTDNLKGTPVVSLKDFGDKDNTKNKYGQTVPKKLKKDDPRVKFHKDDKKQGVAEGS